MMRRSCFATVVLSALVSVAALRAENRKTEAIRRARNRMRADKDTMRNLLDSVKSLNESDKQLAKAIATQREKVADFNKRLNDYRADKSNLDDELQRRLNQAGTGDHR